jgi:hypothetical protein
VFSNGRIIDMILPYNRGFVTNPNLKTAENYRRIILPFTALQRTK